VKTKKVSKDERGLFRNGLLRARRVSRTFPSRRGRTRPPLRRASDERENAASRHAGNTPHAKPYESKSLRLPLRTLARFHHHARVLLVRALRVVGRSLRVISASVHEGVALHDASGEGSRVEQLMVGRTGRTGVMYVQLNENGRRRGRRLRNPSPSGSSGESTDSSARSVTRTARAPSSRAAALGEPDAMAAVANKENFTWDGFGQVRASPRLPSVLPPRPRGSCRRHRAAFSPRRASG
jgi:hypothetical protein